MKHCLILAALLFIAPYAAAQKTVSTSYNLERETYRDVQEKIEKSVIPISRSLAHTLTTILPADKNGKRIPLGLSIDPTKLDGSDVPIQAIVHYCLFGNEICKPFFEACAALYLNCSDGHGQQTPSHRP